MGLAGSPSIWVTWPSLTKTRCPQPPAQNGQTECTTLSASDVRGRSVWLRWDIEAVPRPSRSRPLTCLSSGHDPMNVFSPKETSAPPTPAPHRIPAGRDVNRCEGKPLLLATAQRAEHLLRVALPGHHGGRDLVELEVGVAAEGPQCGVGHVHV